MGEILEQDCVHSAFKALIVSGSITVFVLSAIIPGVSFLLCLFSWWWVFTWTELYYLGDKCWSAVAS